MTELEARLLAKLRERAERLARPPEDDGGLRFLLEVAVLGSATDRLGIPVDGLREIVRTPPVTRLPALPTWIRGLVQIRGELLSVVDPSALLGLEAPREGRLLAVVEQGGRAVGLLADQLLELRRIHREELAESLADAEGGSGLVQATTRDLLQILDIESLVADPRLVVGEAPAEAGDTETAETDPPTE